MRHERTKFNSILDLLVVAEIILLLIITLAGVFSFSTTHSYDITNQYGDIVKIYGYGIYAHDSYFKAPIFIGSDMTMLLVVIPMLITAYVLNKRKETIKTRLFLASVMGLILYYSASIAFGVTYNSMHLLYIVLFSVAFYSFIMLVRNIDKNTLQNSLTIHLPTSGITAFLLVSGIALCVAWLPDIISSLLSGKSLALIEVYTTEITYIIDMGIISPLMFICIYLLRKKDGLGLIILSVVLTVCVIIGIMLPVQTLFHTMAGIRIPTVQLIIKIGSFVMLAGFALYFLIKLYKGLNKT